MFPHWDEGIDLFLGDTVGVKGATVKAGTQECGTEIRCKMMNTHVHIVKAHMVIDRLVYSLAVQPSLFVSLSV